MNTIRLPSKKVIISILILSCLLSMPVMAEGIPPLPNAFSGNVTLGGSVVPVGTEINAYIDYQNDTDPDGSVTVSVPGYYELHVQGSSADHQKEITFIIGNSAAVQTSEFNIYSPAPANLDLSTTGASVMITAENDSMFSDITDPAEKEILEKSDEASESLDGFSLILAIGALVSVFLLANFGRKGDF